jgi:hypothetical protein
MKSIDVKPRPTIIIGVGSKSAQAEQAWTPKAACQPKQVWKPKEASSEAEPSVEAQGSAEAKSSVEVALRNTYGDVVVDINEKRSDLELGAS